MVETDILIEGVSPDDISKALLVDLMGFIEEQGYSVEGVSILRQCRYR